ncbi:MAG TPA: hypothetical protein VMN39_04295, partial [Longimicrobiaceae bacterium]|nr:hypothetical protein [Longimicrobiaceae bacterium]
MNQLRRPLVAALLAFLAGLLATLRLAPPPPVLAVAFGLLAAVLVGASGKVGFGVDRGLLLALFVLCGSVVGSVGARNARADCRNFLADGAQLAARGVLAAAHREGAAGAGAPLLPLAAGRIGETPTCRGDIRFRMPPGQADLPPGTPLTVRGEWRTSAPAGPPAPWPGDPRFAGFLLADSVVAGVVGSTPSPWLRTRAWADARLADL